ncbi:UNVERIFIED_CONTAM: hypothetical protein HDU68_004910, partial [Siphonaria sp. JEL0065]
MATNDYDQSQATLAAILTALDLLQTQLREINEKVSVLPLLQQQVASLSEVQQNMENKINKIANKSLKFYTRISDCPPDVLGQILRWIHPKQAFRLRRICKTFDQIINSKSFAKLNLACFVPPQTIAGDLNTTSIELSEFNSLYFKMPTAYQTVYSATFISHLTDINWFRSKILISDCAIPPSLGSLSRLVKLNMAQCCLKGPIPSEFSQLKTLEYLNLDGNLLSGEIPREL